MAFAPIYVPCYWLRLFYRNPFCHLLTVGIWMDINLTRITILTVNSVTPFTNTMDINTDILDSELVSSSESGSVSDLIPCRGCVFCRTHLNTSTKFRSSVTGKQFTLSSNEIPNTLACTSKNVIYLITCDKCCIPYVGMTTTNIRTRFDNHRSCMKNYKRNILFLWSFLWPRSRNVTL